MIHSPCGPTKLARSKASEAAERVFWVESKAMRHGELTAPIVKSIQEQQQEIAAQRREIASLRHTLADQAALKAEIADLRRSMAALREQGQRG
jgi:hypothetical protein